MALTQSNWRGVPAWTLESDRLRVVTTPDVGAKITSIFDKKTGYEWLIAPADRPFQPVAYGAEFIVQDMSGWDEMLPTIKPCRYPAPGPYLGAPLPDHGEVWALPWDVEAAEDSALTLAVEGRALPYRFTRSLSLADPATLRLGYTLTNTGDGPITALWAAHPQFTATPHTRIRLPEHVTELVNVRLTHDFGAIGLRYRWPQATTQHGAPFALDRVAPPGARNCRKLYTPPEIPVGWAALVEEPGDHWLCMAWSPDEVPYLGIWVDEGAVNSVATAALEITTGFHDSLETAWGKGRSPLLAPGAIQAWTVTVRVGSGPLAAPAQPSI